MMRNIALLIPTTQTSKHSNLFGMKLNSATASSLIIVTHLAMKVKDTLLVAVSLMGLMVVFPVLQGPLQNTKGTRIDFDSIGNLMFA